LGTAVFQNNLGDAIMVAVFTAVNIFFIFLVFSHRTIDLAMNGVNK
jgi:hypothetical protein